jgi:hypothetical protein
MRRQGLWWFLAFWLAGRAVGQVTVEVVFERNQYLAGERMQAGVRITNFSGRTLRLGDRPDWLDVTVEGEDGFLVDRTGDPPVVEAFEVPNSGRATRRVDLVPYFNIGKMGHYRVIATVRIAELGQELTTKPAGVHVVSGAKLWEQAFGIPMAEGGKGGAPDVRKYALVQALGGKQAALYVRLTDAQETKIHGVLQIGPMLAFSRPETQVDREARLHVLFQVAARQFTYVMVSPDGELVARQTHQYTDTRPVLRSREGGEIVVSGGTRVRSLDDVPPSESVPSDLTPPKTGPGAIKVEEKG